MDFGGELVPHCVVFLSLQFSVVVLLSHIKCSKLSVLLVSVKVKCLSLLS